MIRVKIKGIICEFVLWYIRTHMDHKNADIRGEIFEAVNEGIARAFLEDNIPTRFSNTVRWLLENDREFQAMAKRLCLAQQNTPKGKFLKKLRGDFDILEGIKGSISEAVDEAL